MYLALDIETVEKPMPEDVLAEFTKNKLEALREEYQKEDTVQKHLLKSQGQFLDRWKFSREGARIICIGVYEPEVSNRWAVQSGDEEAVVRTAFNHIRSITQEGHSNVQRIFTFNGDKFDLPILLAAACRYKLKLGYPLKIFTDLMKWPLEIGLGMISLERLAAIYGVEWPETEIPGFPNPDGSQVAAMHDADGRDAGGRVAKYCADDCQVTWEIGNRIGQVFPW